MKDNQEDKRTLRVASVQFENLPGDKEANFHKIETFVEQAASQNVRMIIFPECCITGYWFIRNLSVRELGWMADDDMVIAELDASLLADSSGRRWIRPDDRVSTRRSRCRRVWNAIRAR